MSYKNNKFLLFLLTAIMIFILTSCSSNKQDSSYDVFSDDSSPKSSADISNKKKSDEKQDTPSEDKLNVITIDDFKAVVSSYGEIQDVSSDFGFDAIAVHSENSMNYIFMSLENETAAKSMIFGGEDSANKDVTVIKAGDNYDYYEEHAKADDNYESGFFGYYLRVENTLILITGPSNDISGTRTRADDFLSKLGYTSQI